VVTSAGRLRRTKQALWALGLSALAFVLSYVWAYRRQVYRTLDVGRSRSSGNDSRRSLPAALCTLLIPEPRERAVISFVMKTLFRSPSHLTYAGGYPGVGLAFVVMGIAAVILRHGAAVLIEVRSELLSVPLVLGFFAAVGACASCRRYREIARRTGSGG